MTPLSSASSRTVTSPHSDRKRCGRRNLEPNTLETAEKIVDFRRMVGLALLIPVTGSSGSFPQRHTMAAGAEGPGMSAGYVKEFTRHCSDVLLNLNELRHRAILTDATLAVGDERLRAHSAVLVACSGFFYSLYTRHTQHMTVSLPSHLEPTSVSLLLDFMYTSRLPLTPATAPGVLAAAAHLQMDHVADTCREFMRLHCRENMSMRHPQLELDPRVSVASVAPQGGDLPHPGPQAAGTVRVPGEAEGKPGSEELKKEPDSPPPSPDSPARSSCQPSSPAESETCNKNLACDTRATLDPKLCNWKKYKFIVLNPLCAGTSAKEEPRRHALAVTKAWPGEVPGQIDRQGRASCYEGSGRAPPLGPPASVEEGTAATHYRRQAVKKESSSMPCGSPGNAGGKTVPSGDKPYRCNVCGAQFNRPANLKTHARIHSGEKPYRCDTCGARFVQVAHLRAHVLIHTGEKPYPCHTCGTRFRHLQTLKSHLRIHTGEKPYSCEKCDLRFRHKSQLRLHLRQKHGAVTNTKVRYRVLSEPYPPVLQAC
ncbi:B-cell CLL/lymphoma 6 member B protein isoform X1 [Phycodurus eques]|uniref:B-cell CLL/lymphoma 6 member B protein isoform X1 n=2 Tax=Phycodurus eques TaxID=693459 RepID=UPI002ACDC941|nr:B-cell CLL/lymphoma 6 member B protein isoform X1 [Phycodurus eques]XP_061524649.1 B-cell CLL/lymphoma 6 member B protein isoform X1 [Phycodurus eques]